MESCSRKKEEHTNLWGVNAYSQWTTGIKQTEFLLNTYTMLLNNSGMYLEVGSYSVGLNMSIAELDAG